MQLLKKIYWKQVTNGESYLYGSEIVFLDNMVRFSNLRASSGKMICRWQSRTNYQGHRFSPDLPLLCPDEDYCLVTEMETVPADTAVVQIDFFNRQGETVTSCILREKEEWFHCPKETFTYTITIKNAGCERLDFYKLCLYQKAEQPSIVIAPATANRYVAANLPNDLDFVSPLLQREETDVAQ